METAVKRAKVVKEKIDVKKKEKTGVKKKKNRTNHAHQTENELTDSADVLPSSANAARNLLQDGLQRGVDNVIIRELDAWPLDEINSNTEECRNRKTSGKRQQAWTPVKSPQAKRLPNMSTPR